MSALLSRFSLKVQIGSLVALAGLILASLLVVQGIGGTAIDAADKVAEREGIIGEQAVALNLALLDGRRREKDFLLYKDAKYVAEHAQSAQAALDALDAMTNAMEPDDPRRTQAAEVRKGITLYIETFRRMTEEQTRVGLNEKEGLMGTLRASVHEVETALKSYDELRLAVLMLMMRRHEKDFLARLDAKYIGELDQRVGEFGKAIGTSAVPIEAQAAILERMAAYQRDFKAAAEGSLKVAETTRVLSENYAATRPAILSLIGAARADMAAARAESVRIDRLVGRIALLLTLVGFTAMAVIGIVVARSIYQPLDAMRGVMARLAKGDMAVTVPDQDRGDEVGGMARSVQVFKEELIEVERLRAQQEEERKRAEREKIAALEAMAETVERETRNAVASIAEMTHRMADNADGMAQSAGAVGQNSQSVAAAAAQALSNAQTVAAAAEQLSASIREIAGQVGTATQVTGSAAQASERARGTITLLSDSVGRIGEVAGLINDIASQTNLLALNATIEAARAGEAGKGFAVVANEVKHLASQTAKATEDITRLITEIQASTGNAVQAVADIAHAITDVQGVSTAVASAIEEQGAATQEIARNVAQTSDAAQEVAERIARVSDEARLTGERAGTVGSISAEVATGIDHLREVLVRVVRTATVEVNRRRSPRYAVDRGCTVIMGGRGVSARLVDCSEGGFGARGDLSGLSEGKAVEIAIDGIASHLHATIRSLCDERAHAEFDVDEAKSPTWRQDFAALIAGGRPMAA